METRHETDRTLLDVEPDAGLLEGRVLDERYELVRRLGHGGMGVVYAARHVVLGNRFAVKVLRPPPAAHAKEATERFKREARAASALGHPNIVDVKDFGELPGGLYYYVIEHLEKRDLLAELEAGSALPPKRLANIGLQVAEAMGAAHAKGIVHRDLKPENVFLTSQQGEPDHVKLIDFGIAKVSAMDGRIGTVPPLAALALASTPSSGRFTAAGIVLGTPAYMSPEQCRGGDIDFKSDLYALGILLYEAATGDVPFEGETVFETMRMHQELPAPDPRLLAPSLPDSIADMILALLEKDPLRRPASMQIVADALLPFVPSRERPSDAAIEAAIRASVVAPVRFSKPNDTPYGLPMSALARASSSPPTTPPQPSVMASVMLGAAMGLALVVGAGAVFGVAHLWRGGGSMTASATSDEAHDVAVAAPAASEPPAEVVSIPSAPPPDASAEAANAAPVGAAPPSEATVIEATEIEAPAAMPTAVSPIVRPTATRRERRERVAAPAATEAPAAPRVETHPSEPPSAHPRPTDAVRDPWAN